MNAWLEAAAGRLAAAVGGEPGSYALADGDVETLLDLARVAAHESGDRTNAPLLCYLVGLAHGRTPEAPLANLTREAGGPET